LNFAFDLGESKTIPTQKLTELEQRSLVQTWYEYDASITPIGVPETRQSKTTSNLSKVTEEIRKDNPQLVAEIFKERIETNIDKLNVTNDKKQKLRSSLVAGTVASLADHTKPLSEIRADVTNTIQQNMPKKTWLDTLRDTLKEAFKAAKEAAEKTFNDFKDTMVKIFSSGSANNPKNKYAAPPEPTTNKTEDKGKVTIKNTEQAKYKSFSQIPPPPQTPPVPHQQQKKYTGR
jgi:HD superfamily phosphohydrolase